MLFGLYLLLALHGPTAFAWPSCDSSFKAISDEIEHLDPGKEYDALADAHFKYLNHDQLSRENPVMVPMSVGYYFDLVISGTETLFKKNGIKYEAIADASGRKIAFKVLPEKNGVPINNLAAGLKRRMNVNLQFAPENLKQESSAALTGDKFIIIDIESVASGFPSPTLVHEIRHAYLNFREPASTGLAGIRMGAFKTGVTQEFNFGAYPDGFRIDEIMTHLQEFRLIMSRYFRAEKMIPVVSQKIKNLERQLEVILSGDETLPTRLGLDEDQLFAWPKQRAAAQAIIEADLEDQRDFLAVVQKRKILFERFADTYKVGRIIGMAKVVKAELKGLEKKLLEAAAILTEHNASQLESSYFGFVLPLEQEGAVVQISRKLKNQWILEFSRSGDTVSGYGFREMPTLQSFSQFLEEKVVNRAQPKLSLPQQFNPEQVLGLAKGLRDQAAWLRERSEGYALIEAQAVKVKALTEEKKTAEAVTELRELRRLVLAEYYIEIP